MPERPYTLLSCGMSIDGYLDTATDERLVLSNDADLDRVDAVRAVRSFRTRFPVRELHACETAIFDATASMRLRLHWA
jgi:hypothetical protein